ncbi:MAG: hypothetical protein RIQ79_2325 [Verrucomicrobiota bacterium]
MKPFLFPLFLAIVGAAQAATPSNAILYVTQMPIPDEVLTHTITETKMSIVSTMQSPLADPAHAGRGGGLWIRYANGTKRNLTAAAGYGGTLDVNSNATGQQGASGIAVHHPSMHWSGTKAIFGMVVGAPTGASDTTVFHWQLYEITNFGLGQTPVISYVTGQPANYNNFEACYDTQDRIIFVSDAPHAMQSHLYPQLDEYMNIPTNTGLWRLDRTNANELKQIIHTPSGAFTPFLDSAGRVLFVQWDHLSRDVSSTYDRPADSNFGETWTQTFNGDGTFASEDVGAGFTHGTAANYSTFNTFPEPRNFDKKALAALGNVNGNAINQFFPWECREDGSSHEIINHVGRHEFGGSNLRNSFTDDPNLVTPTFTGVTTALDMLHLIESPTANGTFYAVNPPELGTHMAGPILRFNGALGTNPDTMVITYVTPNVSVPNPGLQPPLTNAVDIYRNPLPLTDGNLLAVHAAVKQYDVSTGADAQHPKSRYDFKLRMLQTSGATMVPDLATTLVTEPNVSLSYYANGTLITYSGSPLWELDPVEVVVPVKPTQLNSSIASVEQTVFDEEGVHAPTLQNYLRTNNLAMVVNRDSTRRDAADKQQPFNLKVSWSATQTTGASGKLYDIGWVQILQADAIRGFTLSSNATASPQPGRRSLPVPLHDSLAEMPVVGGAPSGAVKIGTDGSWAAILPAGRALTWHMLDGAGTASQVKERYWVTFAPGEVRTCAVCHGVNTRDQAGNLGVPTNKPLALRTLLQFWKANHPSGTLQHASASASVLKNAVMAVLSVNRTGGGTGPASVTYSTADGTALASTDYYTTSGTLTWADADTAPKTINVLLRNNPALAASKTFTVTLANPLYGALGTITTEAVTITETPLDAWRLTTFGANATTPGVGLPADDPDGDGMDNQSEFIAGTVPTDATSVLTLQPGMSGGQMHLSFTAQAGVSYTIQYKDALTDPTWLKLLDIAPSPSAQLKDIVDPAPVTQRFYRAATPQQP